METLHKISILLSNQGKSQKDLTDYLGIKKTAYTQWKLGKNHSYNKHIGKIANFLGVSADYLLGTEQKEKSPLSNIDSELLAVFEKLSDDGKAKALDYAKLLLEAKK